MTGKVATTVVCVCILSTKTLCKYVVLCVLCEDGNSKVSVYSQCATYFECFPRSFLPFLAYIGMLVTPKSITGAVSCVYVCV